MANRFLKRAQDKILCETPRRYGRLARTLFSTIDILYAQASMLERFEVLEIVARVPYQAWENVGYVKITQLFERARFARRIFDFVREARAQQDNEQWHLFIVKELRDRRGERRSFVRGFLAPQLLALFYYHISWILYVVAPRWSYLLNADFEDHAMHTYMRWVAANPALESERWESRFAEDYGKHETVADLFRQIALDERAHRDESLAHLADDTADLSLEKSRPTLA